MKGKKNKKMSFKVEKTWNQGSVVESENQHIVASRLRKSKVHLLYIQKYICQNYPRDQGSFQGLKSGGLMGNRGSRPGPGYKLQDGSSLPDRSQIHEVYNVIYIYKRVGRTAPQFSSSNAGTSISTFQSTACEFSRRFGQR